MTNQKSSEKTEKTYKALFVPNELHYKIKLLATKQKKTIIQFIEALLSKREPN
jgi:hypothetical protein